MNSVERDPLSERIIGLAMAVHRVLGPGLLESAYEECLCFELAEARVTFSRQQALPVSYKGVHLDCGYRMDLVVENQMILELKSVEKLQPIHEAQMLTYLRLSRHPVGLLINFNSAILKDGIRRFVL
ncbi:MAG TPA: GxxExxY protein [Telmatospirillum sp.]|nr:GxxExxY protein [Telmatospirillum sp.]